MKRFTGLLLLVLSISATHIASGAVQSAEELVKQTAERMLSTLRAENDALERNPDRVYDLVNEIVLPHFDFPRMAKRVLGKHWRKATPQQRREFTEAFRDLLVRTYTNSLTEYAEQEINYLPLRAKSGAKNVTVRSEIEQPGSTPIDVSYRLGWVSNEWKVYDVSIEGVSLVTNYRSSFSREISQGGLGGLIDELARRSQQPPND